MGYIEQTCECINKTLGFLGNGVTHARIGLHTQTQARLCKLDHTYTDPCLENLKTQKRSRTLKTTN